MSSEAARRLLDFDWPGNVRQLENSMEQAVALTVSDHVTVEDLPERIRDHNRVDEAAVESRAEPRWTLEELERWYIARTLKANRGNKTRTAKILGLDRRTLYRKLERYRVHPSSGDATLQSFQTPS